MQSTLAEQLWRRVSRVIRLKTIGPELSAGCPRYTRALARSCWLVIVCYTITSFVVYRCVKFPSHSNVQSVPESVTRDPERHALVNSRISSVYPRGHLLNVHLRTFGRQRIQLVKLECFDRLNQDLAKGHSRQVSIERLL